MARDYTKYNVEGVGEKLNKRRLVYAIIEHYAKTSRATFEEMQSIFPDTLQGSGKGVIRNCQTDSVDANRFFRDTISLPDAVIRVSNQWGLENVTTFIDHARGLGYSIEELGDEESNISRLATGKTTLDLMTDSGELICSLNNLALDFSGENGDLQEDYENLLDDGNLSEACLLVSRVVARFEREIYSELLTRAIPSDNSYGWTIDDLKSEDFDWFEVCPHVAVRRVGELDLSPIVCLDESDDEMIKKCSDIFKEEGADDMDVDTLRDYITDYECDARFSVDDDLFKEVAEEV